jgi:hypothetical protein
VGCNCGKARAQPARRGQTEATREYVDPTRALFAAARPSFEVTPLSGGRGKRFSTLAAAQDYARRIQGVIRTL